MIKLLYPSFFVIIFLFLRVSSAFNSLNGYLSNWGRLPCLEWGACSLDLIHRHKYKFCAKVGNSLSCHSASCLEPFCYCLFGAIIVKTHLQYHVKVPVDPPLYYCLFYPKKILWCTDLVLICSCGLPASLLPWIKS